ncbi:protein of unknown function [Ruminococcaceae bacterium BL-4]|nr:protein of unknown function [Ruminococcaceae bacterium BL-4]
MNASVLTAFSNAIRTLDMVRVIRVMNESLIRDYLSCDSECLSQIPYFINLHNLMKHN